VSGAFVRERQLGACGEFTRSRAAERRYEYPRSLGLDVFPACQRNRTAFRNTWATICGFFFMRRRLYARQSGP